MTTDILEYQDYEDWNELSVESITYLNKNLDTWAKELSLPDLDLQIFDQVEQYNQSAIKLTELIATHCSLTKASFYSAKAAYSSKMHRVKCDITDAIADAGGTKRAPSQDTLERLAHDKSLKEWRVMIKAEIVYEFWQTHSYKINQIHGRLTSMNVLQNINAKNKT